MAKTPNRIDIAWGSAADGSPDRVEGHAKAAGQVRYAADHRPEGTLEAVLVTSTIARGRVSFLDVKAALAHEGVVHVMTPQNRPDLAQQPDEKRSPFNFRFEALQDDTVRYAGQIIAVVIAKTFAAACHGATLLAPEYEALPPRLGLDATHVEDPAVVGFGAPAKINVGDIAQALAKADHLVTTQIETPVQVHNAMEPHAVVAQWQHDRLILNFPSQSPAMIAGLIAQYLGLEPDQVEVHSPYIGGGFGSKLMIHGAYVLAPLAAKLLGAPVRLTLARGQMFGQVGLRAQTRQKLTLGVSKQGRITGLQHESLSASSSFETFVEQAGHASAHLYAAPALAISHQVTRADIGTPLAMRAPGEAPGSAALELAMDAAAEAAGMDPLAFRLQNYAHVDPSSGKPFSSKQLEACYHMGAKRFGWQKPRPPMGSLRDASGRLIGWGVGTSQYSAGMFHAEAEVVIDAKGLGHIRTSSIDMGQGARTAVLGVAAEQLGLAASQVRMSLGVSSLPNAGTVGGSAHTATISAALRNGAQAVLAELAELAFADPLSPLHGAGNQPILAKEGALHLAQDPSRSDTYADILARAGRKSVSAKGIGTRAPQTAADYAMFSHGAVFVEVAVDPDLGQVLVRRIVGAFAAGRILNQKLARSQLEGGMIWALSFALHEETHFDPVTGRVINADLAGYHIPVHADIPQMEVLFAEEHDPYVNDLGVKGVGELAITGTVGAIASAIRHATGASVTSFPIKIESLLGL